AFSVWQGFQVKWRRSPAVRLAPKIAPSSRRITKTTQRQAPASLVTEMARDTSHERGNGSGEAHHLVAADYGVDGVGGGRGGAAGAIRRRRNEAAAGAAAAVAEASSSRDEGGGGEDRSGRSARRPAPPARRCASRVLSAVMAMFMLVCAAMSVSFLITGNVTFGYHDSLPNWRRFLPVRPRRGFPREMGAPFAALVLTSSYVRRSDPHPSQIFALTLTLPSGVVYDVTSGRSHYGPKGGYRHFAGRDAARAFVTGCFETHRTHDLRGFTAEQLKVSRSRGVDVLLRKFEQIFPRRESYSSANRPRLADTRAVLVIFVVGCHVRPRHTRKENNAISAATAAPCRARSFEVGRGEALESISATRTSHPPIRKRAKNSVSFKACGAVLFRVVGARHGRLRRKKTEQPPFPLIVKFGLDSVALSNFSRTTIAKKVREATMRGMGIPPKTTGARLQVEFGEQVPVSEDD
ncbi:MAG: hypothetical protein BJ554DRAFT_5121, partial [Olpidium bornovanus]